MGNVCGGESNPDPEPPRPVHQSSDQSKSKQRRQDRKDRGRVAKGDISRPVKSEGTTGLAWPEERRPQEDIEMDIRELNFVSFQMLPRLMNSADSTCRAKSNL